MSILKQKPKPCKMLPKLRNFSTSGHTEFWAEGTLELVTAEMSLEMNLEYKEDWAEAGFDEAKKRELIAAIKLTSNIIWMQEKEKDTHLRKCPEVFNIDVVIKRSAAM